MEAMHASDRGALHLSPVRRETQAALEPAREAFTLAWRPAGSRSLGERWLRAGEREGVQRASPPRPPAPPPGLKLKVRKLKR